MKELACKNSGTFYQVVGSAVLGEVMSSYCVYYAAPITCTELLAA